MTHFTRLSLSVFAVAAIFGGTALAADYSSTVAADAPLAYYRFNDSQIRGGPNLNTGSLGAAGNATNLNVRAYPGAIVGDRNRAQFFDSTARSIIPFNAALNTDNTKPFTLEGWFYPASDQINAGQAVINNRYAYSGVQRQGWVIFQRAPNDSYSGKPGYEGVGWNFRMYAGGTGIDVRAEKPYEVGSWVHFVAVYDPDDAAGPTTTVYINGEAVNSGSKATAAEAYIANTDDHGAEAINGPAGMAFGAYNNTAVDGEGNTTQANPYFGAIDEVAFYASKLSPEKILAHYQNGTNAARTISYEALVQSDSPAAYLRMDEVPTASDKVINIGELRNAGDLTVNNLVQRNTESALESEWNDHSIAAHRRDGAGTRANIPFLPQNNPTEDIPFSLELWVRPDLDRVTPGAAVINNRKAAGNRSGWVIFQRAPNETYSGQSGYEGVGYNFRMYTGTGGSGGANITTRVPYKVGEWQHLVFTWQPTADTGSGNWDGTLTAYVNGTAIVPGEEAPNQVTGVYHANTDPTDDGTTPADLAIGSYNAASNWGQEFDGAIDEVAIYTNWVLTAEQVLAHYQAATNSHPETNYSSLVLSAPYQGSLESGGETAQRIGPVTYLRFNDIPPFPAANSGTLGAVADGALQGNAIPDGGLEPPEYPGFEDNNITTQLGDASCVSLNNPEGLNFDGNITLEAWIQPGVILGERSRIISHGPALLSLYAPDAVAENGSIFTSPEVFLQIDGTGANYTVGSSDGTNTVVATAPIPAGDFGGNDSGVHLAGTYDGTNWKLYRNGTLVATSPSAIGALKVPGGDWAIGSAGMGWADPFSDTIDEVAIYNKALTAAQVQQHYESSVGTPTSELRLSLSSETATTITFTWTGGSGKFLVQKKTDIGSAPWTNVQTTTGRTVTVNKDGQTGFFRVQDNYTGPDIP